MLDNVQVSCIIGTSKQGSKQMTKEISARLITLIASGLTVKQAIDQVLGEGTYDKLASDIWEAAQ